MRWETFWTWYDWAARVHFAGTMISAGIGALTGGVAYLEGWDWLSIVIAMFVAFAAVAILYLAFCAYWDRRGVGVPDPPIQAEKALGTAILPDIEVALNRTFRSLDDYRVVCAIDIKNSNGQLDDCLVEMTEFSGTLPGGMELPATLRSADQIQGNGSGRFALSKGQQKSIPIIFVLPTRKNEWLFIDERRQKYPMVAQPTRVVLHIYGGKETQVVRLFIEIDAGWMPLPRLESVKNYRDDAAHILIRDAALIAFETAEEIGIVDLVSSIHSDPLEKLSYFLFAFLSDDGISLFGKRAPSRNIRPIPRDELNQLHPVPGTSSLRSDFAASPNVYEDVSMKRSDLDRYLERLCALRELGERRI